MISFFWECGLIRWPLLLITIANIVIAVRSAVKIAGVAPGGDTRVSNSINSLLFWGAFSAVLGFLGQYTGIYKALGAIIHATAIDPKLVMLGFRESFTTTLWGMNLLVWSAVAWAILQGWYRRKASVWETPRPAE